jgi:alpha-glucosidase (family GH31 glycosyl hydrolase)
VPAAPEAPPVLPVDHALHTASASVEVVEDPLAYRIRDAQGRVLLSTLPEQPSGGYAPVAWTEGTTSYRTIQSPGYTAFSADLEPWRNRFDVDDVWASGSELSLRLVDAVDSSRPAVVLTFHIHPRAVRVEAELEGHAPRAWSVAFSTDESEAFLGFGERYNRTNQRGLDVWNWSEEGGVGIGEGTRAGPKNPWPNGALMTGYPVPFFVSSRGYGFWLDTTYRSEFELASRRSDAIRVWHVGPTLEFEVLLPNGDGSVPWPLRIVDAFTERTGRPAVPPGWAFGARRRVAPMRLGELRRMRDEDLAITAVDDAVHFFPTASQAGREQPLAAWVSHARELGYRVDGYYNSLVARDASGPMRAVLAAGLDGHQFLARRDGSLPEPWIYTGGRVVHTYLFDFTERSAVQAFQSTFEWARELGYSGFMYDFGEYVPADVVAADGTTGEELHNLYPVLYARAFADVRERWGSDLLAFMRSGYTGASAYMPMVWSGDPAASFEDSDGLPSVVRAGINLGVSGVPNFGSDIGGYHCIADGPHAANDELWVRWIEVGASMPNMQDQNACVGVKRQWRKTNLWKSQRVLDAYRRYARLHTRLFPYFYTLSREAHLTGAPIIRHLFLEHPNDLALASVDDAYYLGAGLLVAPVVVRGQTRKPLHLPEGVFVDWNTGAQLSGPGEVTLDAPIERLPLLLRSGHLIPLLDDRIDTLSQEDSDAIVGPSDVAGVYDVVGVLTPGQSARFVVYDGAELRARYDGSVDITKLGALVNDVGALRDCEACFYGSQPSVGVTRVRFTTVHDDVDAGGLHLYKRGVERVRWDVYLVAPAG